MNVLYFHQHFSTPKGSTGIRSYEMARQLVHKGHSVTLVCGSYGGAETGIDRPFVNGKREGQVDGIRIIEFDLEYSNTDNFLKRSATFIKFAVKSIGLAFTEKYDVLFATTTPLTAGVPGIFARCFRGKPFVFEVRDLWPELPNGCDLDIFSGAYESWRPEGVRESDLLAIFTGAHGIANGLDSALSAAKELKKRNRDDIKIVLVGQGKLKDELVQRARDENIDNVIFHPPVDKSRLSGLMAEADIGLQLFANVPAFYYGTSPNKFFDYISAGLPVLNNYPGWLAGMIEENRCGFAIEPDNPVAFADALERAADDREALSIMGKNSRSLAEQRFRREDLADKWVTWVAGVSK